MPYTDPIKRREYKNRWLKQWRQNNPDKFNSWRRSKRYDLTTNYGITNADRIRMLQAQDGKCAICKRDESSLPQCLYVDHNHQNGLVRSLLCQQCNSLLGYARESVTTLSAAIEYINKWKS